MEAKLISRQPMTVLADLRAGDIFRLEDCADVWLAGYDGDSSFDGTYGRGLRIVNLSDGAVHDPETFEATLPVMRLEQTQDAEFVPAN